MESSAFETEEEYWLLMKANFFGICILMMVAVYKVQLIAKCYPLNSQY